MRASAFVLIASIALPLMPAHATPLAYDFGGQNSHLYNRAQLTRFADDRGYHVVDLTRNHSPTYGDATGYLMMVCTGTGCQYRIPVIWTKPMLDQVAATMGSAMARCDPQSAKCSSRACNAP